jgi:hypothetical protein
MTCTLNIKDVLLCRNTKKESYLSIDFKDREYK